MNRSDFNKEVRVMTQLRDTNIVQVLGVISSAPVAVVVEYMQHGDLFQFLQRHELDGGDVIVPSLRRNTPLLRCIHTPHAKM